MDRKVKGSKSVGSRGAQPHRATLSGPSAELSEADGIAEHGTKGRTVLGGDGMGGLRWLGWLSDP